MLFTLSFLSRKAVRSEKPAALIQQFTFCVSQFGSQLWFIKREQFPFWVASIIWKEKKQQLQQNSLPLTAPGRNMKQYSYEHYAFEHNPCRSHHLENGFYNIKCPQNRRAQSNWYMVPSFHCRLIQSSSVGRGSWIFSICFWHGAMTMRAGEAEHLCHTHRTLIERSSPGPVRSPFYNWKHSSVPPCDHVTIPQQLQKLHTLGGKKRKKAFWVFLAHLL